MDAMACSSGLREDNTPATQVQIKALGAMISIEGFVKYAAVQG
jgi:hypothetical protein